MNKLTEALAKVWSAVNKIEGIDFNQTGLEIKDDLLGIHRKFRKQDGVMDEITNCLQELQAVVDEYQSAEKNLGIDIVTISEVLGNGLYYKTDYETIEFVKIDRLTFVRELNEYAFEKIYGCVCGTNSSNENWWTLNREVFLLKDFGIKSALTKEELEVK